MGLRTVVRDGKSRRDIIYPGIFELRRPIQGSIMVVWYEGDCELWQYDVPIPQALDTLKKFYRDLYGSEPYKIQFYHQRE